jgi:alkaline phosphatase
MLWTLWMLWIQGGGSKMRRRPAIGPTICLATTLLVATAAAAGAQTIYPLNRAEILAGARFDLKVEFPGAPPAAAVRVTINGIDAAAVAGKSASVIEHEDGGDYSAFWIRDTVLSKPGKYVVEATANDKTARVTWEVFDTPQATAKNVILFIGDGMTVAHRTAARILSKGLVEGRYGGELAIDDMPHMALISTSGSDSVVTDSANSMSAYTTGHKSCVNAIGVYCARNKSTLQHPRVETIAEIVKRLHGLSVGVVTNTEIEDATPAGMVAHTRQRADFNDIVKMFYTVQPEVMMGGGSPNFLPAADGGKRTDDVNYIKNFTGAGYKHVSTKTELEAAKGAGRLLGLFNTGNIDGALDRFFLKKGTVDKFPDQPDLIDEVRASLDVLSKNDKGFVLMVESGRIDKYSHSLDWERSVYDTIMLDNAVKVAKEFASRRNDTMVIVVADHAHPAAIIGTYDDDRAGQQLRDKLGVYQLSTTPNYPAPNADGYPDRVDVSRRLAFVFGGFPDYCDTGHPHLDGENVPAVPGPNRDFAANEKNCSQPGAARRTGNLPPNVPAGVHAADDVVLTAMGPGSEQFHGRLDNTRVFRIMATALGLGGS